MTASPFVTHFSFGQMKKDKLYCCHSNDTQYNGQMNCGHKWGIAVIRMTASTIQWPNVLCVIQMTQMAIGSCNSNDTQYNGQMKGQFVLFHLAIVLLSFE